MGALGFHLKSQISVSFFPPQMEHAVPKVLAQEGHEKRGVRLLIVAPLFCGSSHPHHPPSAPATACHLWAGGPRAWGPLCLPSL